MTECNVCGIRKTVSEFYNADKTCKVCRTDKVRANRAAKAEYYREYDRRRANLQHRVEARRAYGMTSAGKAAQQKARAKYIKQNPIKRAAHVILNNAVRDGLIKKPGMCEDCGSGGRIHGHHDDYSKPLEVRWLCAACHHQWHAKHGEAKNAA